jgi:phospholipid:diacylglycerol acyltransferase
MSDLRRRIFGAGTPDSTPSSSRDASPAPIRGDDGEYKIVPKPKLDKLSKEVKEARRKGTKRRNVWIFALGGLFGIFLAGFFASNNGSLDKLVELAGVRDMNLDTLLDVLPAGLIRDVQDLQVRNTAVALLLHRLMLTEVSLIAEK